MNLCVVMRWLNGSRVLFEPALARQLFKLAFILGSAEAAFNLGEQAFYGKGVPVDRDLAISYYEQAYEGGVLCAARVLGSLYCESTDDWTADHHKAVQWYIWAADGDDLDACFLLGCLVLDNHSPTHERALGIYWLQWAAMKGHMMAAEHLAYLYNSTLLAPPDPDGLMFDFWRDHAIRLGSQWALDMGVDGRRPHFFAVSKKL